LGCAAWELTAKGIVEAERVAVKRAFAKNLRKRWHGNLARDERRVSARKTPSLNPTRRNNCMDLPFRETRQEFDRISADVLIPYLEGNSEEYIAKKKKHGGVWPGGPYWEYSTEEYWGRWLREAQ
jgi:hypothetical protein